MQRSRRSSPLTDHKLQGKLILLGFVGAIEGDLDLELLSPTHDEIFGVVKRGPVLLLVILFRLCHHVHLKDVQKL